MLPVVYITTNIINGKKYIGVDGKNDPSYLGSGKLVKKAIDKYGRCNFSKEIIAVFDNIEDAFKFETELIEKLDAIKSNLFYNIKPGGRGGHNGYNFNGENNPMYGKNVLECMISKYGEEEAKIRYDRFRENISRGNIGKKVIVTDEAREKMSKSTKDFYEKISIERRKELGDIIREGLKKANITRSEDYKKKMSESLKNKSKQIHRREICCYCGKDANVANIKRWHNENCKFKKT